MDLHLTGKVALVTGASRGLGLAIARALVAEGMRVGVAARSGGPLAMLADEVGADRVLAFPADLTEPAAPARFVERAVAQFGRIDLVVNNAGATKRGDFLALADADWHDGFELKLHGAVRLCRAAWPHLRATRGSVIQIAGVGGRTGSADFALGGSVNAALMLLTKALADRGTRDGVRVNAINPGSIATDRLTARLQTLADAEGLTLDEAARRMAERSGIERFGRPDEIADAVAYLASDRAAYINGAILDIDGGLTRGL